MPVISPIPPQGVQPGQGADFGPCANWPIQLLCDVSVESAVITGYAVSLATDTLWALTGRQFGLCNYTFRPCRRDCFSSPFPPDGWAEWPWTSTYPQPALIAGSWFNLVCGSCPGTCSCSAVSEFVLPAPVHDIIDITIDGTPMASGAYRLDNNRLVVRTDGGTWPLCNDLSVNDGAEGTWTVTATIGRVIPDGAALAMGQLVCEIIRGAQGEDCNLPPGVTQLIRQGVTIQYPDIGELFRQGRTGLYLVDMFVSTWNPNRLTNRSRVYNVDRPTVRRTDT